MRRYIAVAVAPILAVGMAACSTSNSPPTVTTETETTTVTGRPDNQGPATSTEFPRPSETARTIVPLAPVCSPGLDTSGWNTDRDEPSWQELLLEETDPNRQPSVDAPLVDVRIWRGECHDYDTVEFIIDTNLNDWRHNDRPWFTAGYVADAVYQEGSGNEVSIKGDAFLQVTVRARAAEYNFHHEGHVDTVNAYQYRRTPGETLRHVREVVGAGEQENQFTFGIGVDRKRDFAVEFHSYDDGKTAVVVRFAD